MTALEAQTTRNGPLWLCDAVEYKFIVTDSSLTTGGKTLEEYRDEMWEKHPIAFPIIFNPMFGTVTDVYNYSKKKIADFLN